jgi:hypothetical protein
MQESENNSGRTVFGTADASPAPQSASLPILSLFERSHNSVHLNPSRGKMLRRAIPQCRVC